jgi:polyisoprenoid-binding protein YceI
MTTTTELNALTGDYVLDTVHSRIGFAARHMMVSNVRGLFEDFSGSAHLDGDDPSKSSVELTIQAKSIQTHNQIRDDHLRGNDFLDLANHPAITFTSTAAEQIDEHTFKLTGDLTIRGVTKPVTVDFELGGAGVDQFGNFRIGFEGRATINRKDWGVDFHAVLESGSILVGDKVALEFDLSAIRRP